MVKIEVALIDFGKAQDLLHLQTFGTGRSKIELSSGIESLLN
jgi:hypothetical protein